MERPQIIRFLKIGWTGLCVLACVALIVLWVRSYYRLDTVKAWASHTVSSMRGRLFVDGRFFHEKSDGGRSVVTFFAGTSIPIGSAAAALKLQAAGTPIWFLTFCVATLAAVTWFPWSRRFSLRTLLIATTFIALLLGLIAVGIR